jgi:hypothetical protein
LGLDMFFAKYLDVINFAIFLIAHYETSRVLVGRDTQY